MKNDTSRRWRAPDAILILLLSVLAAMGLTCTMDADPYYWADGGLDGYGPLARTAFYCVRSFSADVGVTSLLAVGIGALLYRARRIAPTGRECAAAVAFGALFSSMQVLGRSYAENGSWDAVFGSGFILFRALLVFLGQWLLGFCLALCAFRLADAAGAREDRPLAPGGLSRKRLLLTAGLVALCWLPYWFLFFPGLSNADPSTQIAWALHYRTPWLEFSSVRGEDIYATNHHPYFTTLLFGLFARLGLALGDITYGIAAYTMIQLLVTALAMTGVWFYLRRLGMPEKALRGALAFTALFPLFPLYAITMLKDTLFSLACLGLSILLLEIARTKGACLKRVPFCCLLFLDAWLVMLSKSQGVYFVAAIGVACLVYKGVRARAAVSLLVPVALFQTVWLGVLLPMWNVAPVGRQEVLGPMFQQTARYVKEYPDDVSGEEADIIRAVIDYDRLPELYDPMLSDPVKFTFRQDCPDEWLRDYYEVWWGMLLRHPDAYLQALIHNTYGSFYVGHETAPAYTHYDSRYAEPYPELCVPLSDRVIQQELVAQTVLQELQRLPVIGLLLRVGVYPWAILLLFLDALRRKRYGFILPLLPSILSVAVLFVSPVGGLHRYAMPFVYAIPFLLAAALWAGGSAPDAGGGPGRVPSR